MRRSTRVMLKRHGWRIDRMVHNYLYFAFYYPYVKIVYHSFSFLSRRMAWFKPLNPVIRAAFDRYHAKVLSGPDTLQFFTIDEDLIAVSSRNKKIIPYRYAHRIILKDPEFLAVMDCPCKLTMGAPDWTIQSCISVGSTTSGFWIDRCAEKYNARRITQVEALEMIRRFRKAGYINQAFFKVATGGCTGVICNCHIDSCVSLQATLSARRFSRDFSMQAESGYSVTRNDDACQLCGTCERYCMFDALSAGEGRGWKYDRAGCMGCGLCTEHCPEKALSLYVDDEKSVPLDLKLVRQSLIPEKPSSR